MVYVFLRFENPSLDHRTLGLDVDVTLPAFPPLVK